MADCTRWEATRLPGDSRSPHHRRLLLLRFLACQGTPSMHSRLRHPHLSPHLASLASRSPFTRSRLSTSSQSPGPPPFRVMIRFKSLHDGAFAPSLYILEAWNSTCDRLYPHPGKDPLKKKEMKKTHCQQPEQPPRDSEVTSRGMMSG